MRPTAKQQAFTLIEFLIALVIIGFIVAILVGVFSSPLKQAKMDSAVSQVKDGLRQWAEAAQRRALTNGGNCCSGGFVLVASGKLVTDGLLTALPAIPAGIQTSLAPLPDYVLTFPGGKKDPGSDTYAMYYAGVTHVTDEFCKAYNASSHSGLGTDYIFSNCDALANGETCSGSEVSVSIPTDQCGVTCCFLDGGGAGINTVIYQTGIWDDGTD